MRWDSNHCIVWLCVSWFCCFWNNMFMTIKLQWSYTKVTSFSSYGSNKTTRTLYCIATFQINNHKTWVLSHRNTQDNTIQNRENHEYIKDQRKKGNRKKKHNTIHISAYILTIKFHILSFHILSFLAMPKERHAIHHQTTIIRLHKVSLSSSDQSISSLSSLLLLVVSFYIRVSCRGILWFLFLSFLLSFVESCFLSL